MNIAGVQAHKYRLASIGLILLAVAAIGFTFKMWRRATRSETKPVSATTARTNAREGGPVYPYSVIPGGVKSATELRRAVERDSVASEHYKGFAVEKARLEIVSRSRLVFVSYRMKDHVYWTRKRIRLRQGETILNDGVHQARTRCGNRIADTPQQEHGKKEPSEQELDTPIAAESGAAVAASYMERPQKATITQESTVKSSDQYLASFGPALLLGGAGAGGSLAANGSPFPMGQGGQGGGAASHGTSPTQAYDEQTAPAPVEWSHVNPIPVTAPGITVSPLTPGAVSGSTVPVSPGTIVRYPGTTSLNSPAPSPQPGTVPVSVFISSPEGLLTRFPVPLLNLPVAGFPGSHSETDTTTDLTQVQFNIPHSPPTYRVPSDVSEVRAPEPSTWIEGLLGTLLLSTGLYVRQRRAKHR